MAAGLQKNAVPALPKGVGRAMDFVSLTKPKLISLVLFTTLVGFWAGSPGTVPFTMLMHTLAGTILIGSGTTACNMYRERKLDARMKRTALRPLATGRLPAGQALLFALILTTAGLAYLLIFVNLLTGMLAAGVFASYLFLYTPLKTKTWLSIFVGAVPGALPTIMGWAAAANSLSLDAWVLFAIVFLWQMPHFFAIGWLHRRDYAEAGFPVISVRDQTGSRTGRMGLLFSVCLYGVTLLPYFRKLSGLVYLFGAVPLGLMFLVFAVRFAILREDRTARNLFLASAFYLPALFVFLLLDKIVG